MPGFVWARQPQIRLVKDFDDKQFWVGGLAGEPADHLRRRSAPAPAAPFGGVTVNDSAAGISQLNSVNNFSFNHLPDVIGKVAFEPMIGGAQPLHVEAFGILRQYYDRVNIAAGSQATTAGLAHRQLHRHQLGRRRRRRRHLDRGSRSCSTCRAASWSARASAATARASCRT